MRPISTLDPREASHLEGLLFDLDDTVLDHGRLAEATYSSLFRLRESGLLLFALTGRPAAWAELVARMWPLDGAIAENGALAFSVEAGRLARFDPVPAEQRVTRRSALEALAREALATIDGLVPADDVGGRVTDFTFDIGEHHRASEETIARAVALAQARGARTTRSSVHLHFTFDRQDKATGALAFLGSRGVEPTRALGRYAFIGDSENDAPCFAAFQTSVGVANLRGGFSLPPRFITAAPRGAGFVEAAAALVRARALAAPGRGEPPTDPAKPESARESRA